MNSNQEPISYTFLPDRVNRPVRAAYFDSLISEIPTSSKSAALWLDGDHCPVNVWRELVDAFVAWADKNQLSARVSSVSAENPSVPLTIEWNAAAVIRGLGKIALMYLLYKIPESDRYSPDLSALRDFVRLGSVHSEHATYPFGPVRQWNGPHPAEEALSGVTFTYLLATVRVNGIVYCFVQLHNMGLYAVKVGSSRLVPDKLSTFMLQRQGVVDRFELIETEHSSTVVEKLSNAVSMTSQSSL